MNEVFEKIERTAEAWKLTNKESNTLRLLGEEMVTMTDQLVFVRKLNFKIKSEEKNFELCLTADAVISPDKKDEFVSVSSDKKNTKAKGLKGKLISMLEDYSFYSRPEIDSSFMRHGIYTSPVSNYDFTWSMKTYLDQAPEEEKIKSWDGLERSMLTNFADDIIVGVNTQEIQIIVKKQF